MTQRLNAVTVAPQLYEVMSAVENYVRSTVEPTLLELVKLRASMINRCTFCVDLHSNDALRRGERPERLFGLAAWREAPFYTDAERAALALTDAATRLDDAGVPDDVWDRAAEHFDDKQLADRSDEIGMINFWNRFAISFRTTPLSVRRA